MEALAGIIGCGVIGSSYFGVGLARTMNTKQGAQIRAVCDPENGDTVATGLEYDAEDSLKSLVSRKDIRAMIVVTPNYLHKESMLAAVGYGLRVFREKPITLSFKDYQEMMDACQENHVVFMTGHVMNFFRGMRKAKELIGQGIIEDIFYCHGTRSAQEGTGVSGTQKKTRSRSEGHLYHYIHELDCVQFLMGGCPETATMAGGNTARRGDRFGDEDDILFITMEYPGSRYAVLEYSFAFRWQEHYLLIQGAMGAIKIDMCNCGMTPKTGQKREHSLMYRTKEEDSGRTWIYRETERDDGDQFGRPGRKPFLWLKGIMDEEMEFLNNMFHGARVTDEFLLLLTGEIARNFIAVADVCTLPLRGDRKVELSEIMKRNDMDGEGEQSWRQLDMQWLERDILGRSRPAS